MRAWRCSIGRRVVLASAQRCLGRSARSVLFPAAALAQTMLRLVTTLGGISLTYASVRLQSGFVLEDAPPLPKTVPASVWYRGTFAPEGSGDNIVGATAALKSWAAKEDAHLVGPGGDFLAEAVSGTVPLKSFFSEKLQDTLTVASSEGLAWAAEPDHGYKFMQVEGYCFSADAGGATALTQYWSAGRNDSFLVVAGSGNENAAETAKYEKKWIECWGPPKPPPASCRAGTDCGGTGEWTTWEDTPPTPTYTNPGTIPFPKSKDLLGWEYKSGANPGYGGGDHVARSADTWYPSWGADGNLYSPWTDGSVYDDDTGTKTASGSGRRLQDEASEPISASSGSLNPRGFTTTGQAIIVGDDPFALNITKVKTFPSSPWPYQGRYPCGSLFYKVCSRQTQHIRVATLIGIDMCIWTGNMVVRHLLPR